MDLAIIAGTALLGLAGTAHCTAMCAAACTAVAGGAVSRFLAWQLGRAAGYATAGALAATTMQGLGTWGAASSALKPLWTLLHAAGLSLGLWMLIVGRLPRFLWALGQAPAVPALAPRPVAAAVPRPGGVSLTQPLLFGMGWTLMPCGMLHSALLTSALASSPWSGAAAMGAFATASGLGLWAGPLLWRQLAAAGASPSLAIRAAGACVAAASGWVLAGGLLQRVAAWCGL